MKKFTLLMILAVSWAGISHAQNSAPYKANYSSKFTIADESYANKILMLWKDFEENQLDRHVGWFADTVSMTLANGQTVKGKDANLAGAKSYRGSLKDYKVSIDAYMSLKSDRGENVVCVWGSEDFTDANGKHVKQSLQEVWGFNKEGKIAMMLQYVQGGGGM